MLIDRNRQARFEGESQRVLVHFGRSRWPHASVASIRSIRSRTSWASRATAGNRPVAAPRDVTARIEAEYDLRITQRLVLPPRLELNAAGSNIPELGLGNGLNTTELGIRLRYEFRREFAPYIGLSWEKRYGDTADFSRLGGEPTSVASVVVGVRAWF